MNILLILCFIFIVIYSCVSWLVPALLSWLFKRKYYIKLKIGRIAVPKLILRDVSLSKDGYSIHIEEVSFKSSFFNSEINKLLSVVIKNLELTNNIEEKRSAVVETILKPLLSKQNSNSRSDGFVDEPNFNLNNELADLGKRKLLDFRNKKLPPSLIMFAQFMGVHIFNATVLINDTSSNAWSLHASASELHADGAAGGPARALVFSANIVDATTKLVSNRRCLAEASCSVLIEGTVKADGPLNVEKIHTVVSNPTVSLLDELYSFLQKNKKRKRKSMGYFEEDHYNTLLLRLSPAIPKIFSLKIDTTKITCIDNTTKTSFETSVQSLQVNSRFSAASVVVGPNGAEVVGLPQVYVAFQMDQVQLIASGETLMFLNKLKLDAKLEKGVLNLYLIISTLNLTYNHSNAFHWYRAAQRMNKSKPLQVVEPTEGAWSTESWWARVACSCAVQGCAELRGVSLRAVRSSAPEHAARALAAGCSGLKVKLDQLLDTREEPYKWVFAQLVVGSRHWSAELLVDGGWVRCGSASGSGREPPPRRHHSWGSALLAVALVKWGTHGPRDSKIEAMMDCLRLEWSTAIAETVISFVDCLNDYKSTSTVQPQQIVPESSCSIAVNVALSHINMFFIISDKMCIMARVDAVTLEKTVVKSGAVVSGLKMVEIVPYQGNVHCQRSDELLAAFFHVKLARIEHVPSKERNSVLLDFQFLENVIFEWSANLHLKILTFVRAFKGFREELRSKRARHNDVDVSKRKRAIDWRVSFKSDTNLSLILSEDNNMLFTTDDMTIAYDHETGLSILWSQLKMVLNGDEIITMEAYSMERAADDPDIRVERKANEGFVLAWNKVWAVNIGLVRVIFPYKHRWADAVQGDFVSLFKWIKIIHGIKKKPFTSDSPLPSDLHIKIDEIIIEMSDDPFEVKLRDNYELLEDEYKESEKRRIMLDAKVQELCKPHLFLPAGKVEELYAALRQKDVQIYVQRCRAAPPPRSRLVACCLSALRVLALADPSLHGAHNATARLRDIDCDSPWPEDGIEFTTLWGRAVSVSCALWQLRLRDFPQPLLSMSELRLWGTLMAAEEQPPLRAVRTVTIEQGEPWGACELERSMMPLKWYYDLCCEMTEYSYAFGPCWEPVIAHCNLAFDQVSRPSLDPSAPLAWWDKVRLLFHGRLTVNCSKFTCLLHVSLDPYNTTEEMEVTWTDLVLDWTNGKLGFLGELKVFVRTASKYDDCRVLRVPVLRLAVKLGWQCVGDPRDHHAVAPCAPTRLPEYSSNQEHDSYRAFRSQGLDLHLSMDTKPIDGDGPVLLLYGSTLRWFESLKLILSGTTRPTRRGRVFKNMRPRKPQLSRHYRNVAVSLTLHNLQVFYWSSSSMQRGIEMLGVRVTCGARHRLALVAGGDALIRRARAVWATLYMNCDLNDAEIWLKTPAQRDSCEDKYSDENSSVLNPPAMEKCYCLSVRRVSYGREAGGGSAPAPTHRLAVHDLRGAWTKLNRDLAFALIDTYIKTQQLKKNLSTKALKEEEKPTTSPKHQRESDVVSPPPAPTQGCSGANSSGGGAHMLAALVAEAGEAGGDAPVVFSDELAGAEADAPPAHPSHAHLRHVLDDDNSHTACLIELVNSQVVLKGCETRGYVILCAARAEVRQRVRRAPAAAAWSGALSAMQYYATVSAADRDQLDENIQWVSVEEIEERWQGAEISTLPDVPRLVGSGHSAGGVIGRTVGPSADAGLAQLQRIVSRCACEFHYVSHEESETAGGGAGGWGAAPEPYDSFTLMHHDLDVCTNSLQYAMLLDVVNNVVLHVEPERRRTLERRARMRFQLQLHRDTDPRHLIHKLQTQVRESLTRLRRLEKEYYLKNRSINGNDPLALAELKALDDQVNECKEAAWSLGEELDAMVRAWREVRCVAAAPAPRAHSAPPHRYNEICFKSARWRLTDADGQLGIADLLLTNFLYTKTSRSDDSVEHQLEVGYVRVTNLLPNEPFPEVLAPQAASGRAPVARRAALRVFCRDRPPVGGISVKEHFEVNIVPIRIGLTKKFFNTMLKFCFPERDPDAIEEGEEEGEGSTSTLRTGTSGSKKTKKKGKDSNSNFYVKRDKKDKDDVEKMKERAEKNKLFIYIKIPEVPVRVSYKGSKEKNLEDVRDLPLVLPTLEYHNVTWTWLDLLLATKSDTRRVIVSQAIRQKLQLHRRAAAAPEPLEEDKARLLLGDRTVAENKPQKKSTPSVFKFSKS
ncbi:protein hobbit [Bicyclus anynana]|uniref:Protein KIAA0100 n=1 Tax=Bicyclus anynana TaxID=110368 RepID=A0A1C9EGI5_BICAN|nr:protein hobbit [Bicyclus anynana]AON96595.1 protein KIAA0100 [Bicyclus anynana]